jgi:hypothetical protein
MDTSREVYAAFSCVHWLCDNLDRLLCHCEPIMRLPIPVSSSSFDALAAAQAQDEMGIKLRNANATATQYRQAMSLSKETSVQIQGKLIKVLNGKSTERDVTLVIDNGVMTIIPPEPSGPSIKMAPGGSAPEFKIITSNGAASFDFSASAINAEKGLAAAMPKVIAKRQKRHAQDIRMRGERFLEYSLSVMGAVLEEVASVAMTFAEELDKVTNAPAEDALAEFHDVVGNFLKAGQALGLSGEELTTHLRGVVLPDAVRQLHFRTPGEPVNAAPVTSHPYYATTAFTNIPT